MRNFFSLKGETSIVSSISIAPLLQSMGMQGFLVFVFVHHKKWSQLAVLNEWCDHMTHVNNSYYYPAFVIWCSKYHLHVSARLITYHPVTKYREATRRVMYPGSDIRYDRSVTCWEYIVWLSDATSICSLQVYLVRGANSCIGSGQKKVTFRCPDHISC